MGGRQRVISGAGGLRPEPGFFLHPERGEARRGALRSPGPLLVWGAPSWPPPEGGGKRTALLFTLCRSRPPVPPRLQPAPWNCSRIAHCDRILKIRRYAPNGGHESGPDWNQRYRRNERAAGRVGAPPRPGAARRHAAAVHLPCRSSRPEAGVGSPGGVLRPAGRGRCSAICSATAPPSGGLRRPTRGCARRSSRSSAPWATRRRSRRLSPASPGTVPG